MKIVVYNNGDQYALSRAQVEALREALPDALWSKIAEFHLCDDRRRSEAFEYDSASRVAYFSCSIKEKTHDAVENAIRELLVGLHRIQDGSEFFVPLRRNQRAELLRRADDWLSTCRASILP